MQRDKAAAEDRGAMRLLLLSSSRTPDTDFLHHACVYIGDFLGPGVRQVLFIPHAAISLTYAELLEKTADVFSQMGYHLTGLHAAADPVEAVRQAEAIVVAGGNTFQLLHRLQSLNLLDAIRTRVLSGIPYVGWSAGSNVACPTIRTTNDMPVVWPDGVEALGLVPFQINPHYTDRQSPEHRGETRDERLQEFMKMNPGVPVVGLREGSALRVESGRVRLLGPLSARIFREEGYRDVPSSEALDFLLHPAGPQHAAACGPL